MQRFIVKSIIFLENVKTQRALWKGKQEINQSIQGELFDKQVSRYL